MFTKIAGAAALALLLAPAGAYAQMAPAPSFVSVPDSSMLASNLKGLNVNNPGGEKDGDISDFVMSSDRRVTGVILSVGGFLGMGEHYVVVDPSSIDVSYDMNAKAWRATMSATKDQLKAAPAFKYEGKWRS